jgi:hypothetical protein
MKGRPFLFGAAASICSVPEMSRARPRFANTGTVSELEAAIETVARDRPDGPFVGSNPFFILQHDQIVGFAARHTVPTIHFENFPQPED